MVPSAGGSAITVNLASLLNETGVFFELQMFNLHVPPKRLTRSRTEFDPRRRLPPISSSLLRPQTTWPAHSDDDVQPFQEPRPRCHHGHQEQGARRACLRARRRSRPLSPPLFAESPVSEQPTIDFTQHALDDGSTVSTQERVVKEVRGRLPWARLAGSVPGPRAAPPVSIAPRASWVYLRDRLNALGGSGRGRRSSGPGRREARAAAPAIDGRGASWQSARESVEVLLFQVALGSSGRAWRAGSPLRRARNLQGTRHVYQTSR